MSELKFILHKEALNAVEQRFQKLLRDGFNKNHLDEVKRARYEELKAQDVEMLLSDKAQDHLDIHSWKQRWFMFFDWIEG